MRLTTLWRLLAGALLAVAVAAAWAHMPKAAAEKTSAEISFERFKALEGEWTAELPKGGKAYARFQVVSNGRAVMEHYRADNLPDGGNMITLYHLDGDKLVLAHYCMAGTHPRMQAKPRDAASRGIDFELIDVANMPRPGAGHMANAKYEFLDADHFNTEWQYVEDGKVKFTEINRYARVK